VFEPLHIVVQRGAAENILCPQRERAPHILHIHGAVSRRIHIAHAELRALRNAHQHRKALFGRRHLGVADLGLNVAVVEVEIGNRAQILVEDRLGISAGLVEKARHRRVPAPGAGLERLLQFGVAECLVALEFHLAQPQLLALVHHKVDGHRARGQILNLVLHPRQVVALGAVNRLNALLVLEEQRQIEGGTRGQREIVADLLAVNLVVAGDGDLPHHRVLLHLENQHAARGALVGEHADIAEEAEAVNIAQISGQPRRAEGLAGAARNARQNGALLNAPIAPHPHLCNGAAGALRIGRRHQRAGGHHAEHQRDALVSGLHIHIGPRNARQRPQALQIGLHRVGVVGISGAQRNDAQQRRAVLHPRNLQRRHAQLLRPAGHQGEHAPGQLVYAVQQFVIAARGEAQRRAAEAAACRSDPDIQAVLPRQFREAAHHHPLRFQLRGETPDALLAALARIGHQRLAHRQRLHHLDAPAGFQPRGEQVGQRLFQVAEAARAVHLEGQHRHHHANRARRFLGAEVVRPEQPQREQRQRAAQPAPGPRGQCASAASAPGLRPRARRARNLQAGRAPGLRAKRRAPGCVVQSIQYGPGPPVCAPRNCGAVS